MTKLESPTAGMVPCITHESEATLNPRRKVIVVAKFPTHNFAWWTVIEELHQFWIPVFEVFEELFFCTFGCPGLFRIELSVGMSKDHVVQLSAFDRIRHDVSSGANMTYSVNQQAL